MHAHLESVIASDGSEISCFITITGLKSMNNGCIRLLDAIVGITYTHMELKNG